MPGSESQPTRRARRPEEKEARREQILEAAATVFAHGSYDDVTMAAVAATAQLGKGTLYIYFSSKEALFAELYLREYDGWLRAIAARLPQREQPVSARRGAETIVETLRPRVTLRRLLRLAPRLFAHLKPAVERNLQGRLEEMWAGAAAVLDAHLAGLNPGDGERFVRQLHAVVAGLAHTLPPVPPPELQNPTQLAVAEAGRGPQDALATEWTAEVRAMVTALLRGGSFSPRHTATQPP